MASSADCLFCKIVAGKIDADVVFEDDTVLAFRDINPQAPTHILIVPRKHVATINDLTEADADDVARLFLAARTIAKEEGLAEDGYRVVMNCMEGAGQSVFHIHLHLLGGRPLRWPPG
jgi:histidine triad (HIT) family protein